MHVGYRRVSSSGQSFERQTLQDCDRIYHETASAGGPRPMLEEMISFCREGDIVLVHSIDRLARDLCDLQQVLQRLLEKGVAVHFLSEGLLFSSNQDSPFTLLQLQMLGAFAQFERALIRQRQAEGIEKAKARGVYRGRSPKIEAQDVQRLKQEGLGAAQIARQMGISRASVYRLLTAKSGA